MSDLLIQPLAHPLARPFAADFTPPGSKSLTNRALVMSAMAAGRCILHNVLFADDTLVMIDCLQRLGFAVDVDTATHTLTIGGMSGQIPAKTAELYCGNSGTTIRFVAALCTLGHGDYLLDGNPRMRQRPIGGLVTILKNLGARIEHTMDDGCPPIRIIADGLPGGFMRYGAEQSSQFLSAALMAAPYARNELRVDLIGQQTSWPYVAMTLQLMDLFHHTPELLRDPDGNPRQIIVPRGHYKPTTYNVEPDASNASYFLGLAAVHPGAKITINGLGKSSLQGDVGFADVLHKMGAGLVFGKDFITVMGADELQGIEVNLLDMPDMAQTLAVVALFAKGPTTIRGLHTLKLKETDRLAALACELQKLGAAVETGADFIIIHPPAQLKPAEIHTYDDHRMAMSFSIAGTKSTGVLIKDIECTHKTYPGFFDDLEKVTSGG